MIITVCGCYSPSTSPGTGNIYLSLFFFFFFLGPHLWHMEVLRLGITLELQLPVYATATATQDLSHICKLHYSLRQRWILDPLSKNRDQIHVLMDNSYVLHPLSHNRNSFFFLNVVFINKL